MFGAEGEGILPRNPQPQVVAAVLPGPVSEKFHRRSRAFPGLPSGTAAGPDKAHPGSFEVERLRVPVAVPFLKHGGIFLPGIDSRLQKLHKPFVAGDAAAVFQWTGALAGDQSSMEPRLGREAPPEQHVVDPEVAEIVHIDASPVLATTEEPRQLGRFRIGRRFAETPAVINRRGRPRPHATGASAKFPQVGVLPAEADLNRYVEMGEGRSSLDLEAPPDARFDVAQGHFEFIIRGARQRLGHRGYWTGAWIPRAGGVPGIDRPGSLRFDLQRL